MRGPSVKNRGTVTRWDAGRYELVSQNEKQWVVAMEGSRLVGQATLDRDENQNWRFSFASRSARS